MFVAGPCAMCEGNFVVKLNTGSQSFPSYCSDTCAKRAKRRRRNAAISDDDRFKRVERSCRGKNRFGSRMSAEFDMSKVPNRKNKSGTRGSYFCHVCLYWHWGHSRLTDKISTSDLSEAFVESITDRERRRLAILWEKR